MRLVVITVLGLALGVGFAMRSSRATATEELFVGCRPDVWECRMSCQERNGIAVFDPELCRDEFMAPYACYCPS